MSGSACEKSIRYNQGVNSSRAQSVAGHRRWKHRVSGYLVGLATLAVITWVYSRLPVNPTTVALTFLLVVLGVASRWNLATATTMALVATLLFNYFFLPPIHTFTISDPQNWIALLAFLASAIVASRLSEKARAEAQNATRRRKEVERLYALSQQLLSTENVLELNNSIPAFVCDAFGATSVAMYLPKRNQVYRAGIEHSELNDERLRAVSVRGEVLIDSEQRLSFVPLRIGVRPVGSLGILDADLSRETLEAVGSLIAISIERAGAVETVTRAEAARESEKLRSALLDSVTHAFRTPLTSIKASVTTLLSSAEVDEAGRKDLLAVIDEEADRLNRLVGEAAEMSQLDAQQVELHLSPHAVSEVVEAGLARARPVLNRREIKIEVPAGLPSAQVDLDRTAEVIAHLLENAAKYSPPQSPITITAELQNAGVNISVADRGPGIDDFEQSLIFEKFYRGRDQRFRVEGTGMGLAIARAIIEAHGGTIGVTSQPGSGSVFHFTIPLPHRQAATAG